MTFNNADMLSTSHGCASCEGRASHFLHVKSDGRHSPVCGDVSAASRANYRQSSEFTPFVCASRLVQYPQMVLDMHSHWGACGRMCPQNSHFHECLARAVQWVCELPTPSQRRRPVITPLPGVRIVWMQVSEPMGVQKHVFEPHFDVKSEVHQWLAMYSIFNLFTTCDGLDF